MKPLPLFDVNASYGKPAARAVDFSTRRSLLRQMDRLGMERAVVLNAEARQHHPVGANRRLLEEHARTDGARIRLVPALAFSGILASERDGSSTLRTQMKGVCTGAQRFVPMGTGMALGRAEPVLRSVQNLHPFLLLSMSDIQSSDILEAAMRFPRIPFLLCGRMWPQAIATYDQMQRCPNIRMEICRHHTWDGIRLGTDPFGLHRLFSGTGSRFFNGPAIAARVRAPLSLDDRVRLAHGNFEAVTGCEGSCRAIRMRVPGGRDRLWDRLLEGRHRGVPLIDAHTHVGLSAGDRLKRRDEASQMLAAEKLMRSLGGWRMVVSGMEALLGPCVEDNERFHRRSASAGPQGPPTSSSTRSRPTRYTVGLTPGSPPPLFVGFKVLCAYWGVPVTETRVRPLREYADRYRLPVLVHTWEDPFDSPALLRDIARQYCEIAFLLARAGGTLRGRRKAEELALEFPHVYLEWSGSFCVPMLWEETLRRVGCSRVVYGSDGMMQEMAWERGGLLSLEWDDAMLRPILGANVHWILSRRQRE